MTAVDEHEYYMMRMHEERIRTFMQFELEACLDEVSWMLRCHNCEVLDCPQEEYPARLLPTPPPSYIDNLQNRLIQARNGIHPASLKMFLNTKYQLPCTAFSTRNPVQPDGMIGEHRAGEKSSSSECDASPRRAAVDTGSEEPGTPQQSPAIITGSGPGTSRAETQMEEEIFPFETSMDSFLRSNFTSMEQECILLQSNVGVNDNRVQPEVGMDDNNDATTQQAAVREEFVSPTEKRQGTTTWATGQHKLFDRGRSLLCNYFSEKRNICLYTVLYVFSARCILPALSIVLFPFCPQKLPKQVRKAK